MLARPIARPIARPRLRQQDYIEINFKGRTVWCVCCAEGRGIWRAVVSPLMELWVPENDTN